MITRLRSDLIYTLLRSTVQRVKMASEELQIDYYNAIKFDDQSPLWWQLTDNMSRANRSPEVSQFSIGRLATEFYCLE